MGSGATAKWALPYPLGTDPPNVPGDIQALAQQVDAVFAGYSQGTLGLRPLASKSGRLYGQTDDIGGLWRDDGANWNSVGSRVQATAASSIAQIIKGVVAQTGDLVQWQDSVGSIKAKIASDGAPTFSGGTFTYSPAGAFVFGDDTGGIKIQPRGAGSTALRVQGLPSQSANLQTWSNSTPTTLAKIDANGFFTATGANLSGGLQVQAPNLGAISVSPFTTTQIGAVIRAVASQTADLQEWQDSTGAVLTKIGPQGALSVTPSSGSTAAAALLSQAGPTTQIAQITKGVGGQTADLQQWQNYLGTVLGKIDASGRIIAPAAAFGAAPVGVSYLNVQNAAGDTATITSIVKAITAQTGDLTQWQNSTGAVLGKIDLTGALNYGSGGTTFGNDANTGWRARVLPVGSLQIGLIVRAITGQSVSLQEWHDSLGNMLSKVDQVGNLSVPDISVAGMSIGRGRVASSTITASFTTVTTSGNILSTLTATFNAVSGRRYQFFFQTPSAYGPASVTWSQQFYIQAGNAVTVAGGTGLNNWRVQQSATAGVTGGMHATGIAEWVAPTTGQYTVGIVLNTAATAGTYAIYADATSTSKLLVDDVSGV